MRQFRVVLLGPSGEPRRSGGQTCSARSSDAGAPWTPQLAGFTPCGAWFAPEPVQVSLSRPARGEAAPSDWELSLVPGVLERAAVVALAAAGVLGALAGPAEASPRASFPCPPGVISSSARTFVPMDRPPEVVLVDARQAPSEGSFDLGCGGPLTDAQGNPILIAAFHSNTPGTHTNTTLVPHGNAPGVNHTNVAPTHSNTPWTNHGNAPGGHTDAAWVNTVHSNMPGGVHTNLVPGDYVF